MRYLAEIADTVREYHKITHAQADAVRQRWHLEEALAALQSAGRDSLADLKAAVEAAAGAVEKETDQVIEAYEKWTGDYQKEELVYHVRGKEFRLPLYTESLSHSKIPKISVPGLRIRGAVYLDAQGKLCRQLSIHFRVFP